MTNLLPKAQVVALAAAEYVGQLRFFRVFTPAMKVERLDSELITKTSPKWDLHVEHAERPYLSGPFAAGLGRYLVVSVEALRVKDEKGFIRKDSTRQRAILNSGIPVPGTGVDGGTRNWYAYAYWFSDDTLYCVMTETRAASYATFTRAGVDVSLSKDGEEFKVNKYLKRAFAFHQDMWFGELLSEARDGSHALVAIQSRFRSNGYKETTLKVSHRDPVSDKTGPLDDGLNLIAARAAYRLAGNQFKVGNIMAITAMSPFGMFKGHMLVVPDSQLQGVDMVLIGPKRLLKSPGAAFSFGVLRTIEGSKVAYSDSQSVSNFQLSEFLIEPAAMQFAAIREESEDEEAMGKMLRGSLERDIFRRETPDGKMIELPATAEADNWLLSKVARRNERDNLGVLITRTPALRRAADRLYADTISAMHMEDSEKRLHIAWPFEQARAAYIVVDPTAFDRRTGKIIPGGGVLRGRQMFMNGLTGECAAHRNPNGTRNEKILGTLVNVPELAEYESAGVLIVSVDYISKALAALGGGDQDDRVIVYTDPQVVEHMKALPPYVASPRPEGVCITGEERVKLPFDPFAPPKPQFTKQRLELVMQASLDQNVALGAVINLIGIDNEMEVAGRERRYDFSWVAESTEEIIDALIRGQRVPWLNQAMKDMRESLRGQSIPYWCLRRMHPSAVEKFSISGYQSRIDSMLSVIGQYADEWKKFCAQREHWIVNDMWGDYLAAQSMASMPVSQEAAVVAQEILDLYKAEFMAERDGQLASLGAEAPSEAEMAKVGGEASRRAQRRVFDVYSDHPLIKEAMVGVWQTVYSAESRKRRGDNGWGVGDAILWGVSKDGRGTADLTLDAIQWTLENPPELGDALPAEDAWGSLETVPGPGDSEELPEGSVFVTLVNGMAKEGEETVAAWKKAADGQEVTFRLTTWQGQEAVRVLVNGAEHSWVSQAHVSYMANALVFGPVTGLVTGELGRNALQVVVGI
jgi:hypothetical protein